MTRKKKETGSRGGKKLKLKRETLKDLDPKRKGAKVKGGGATKLCCIDSLRPY